MTKIGDDVIHELMTESLRARAATSNEIRLLLISNSTQHGQGLLDHCADEIQDFLAGVSTVVFIPFALHDWEAYTERIRERFSKLGIRVRGVHGQSHQIGIIQNAEAVFCGGGNTFRLLELLWRNRLIGAIRQRVLAGMPYIGSSAGVNVACPTIKTTNDMPIVYPPTFEALDLIPFNINPHYLDPDPNSRHQGETRQQRILEFHEMNSNPVLGLREGSWLRREGQSLILKGASSARLFRPNAEPEEFEPGSSLDFLLRPSPGSSW